MGPLSEQMSMELRRWLLIDKIVLAKYSCC